MSRAFRFIAVVAASIAGLLAAELFLQATQSKTMLMGLWYSRGIHTPSERFGLVFTPNYEGVMQHPEGVLAEPLALDEYGFRQPAVNRPVGPYADVLFIGGMSLVFSYGLSDDETLHAQAARSARHAVRVRNTAWPGFEVARNYDVARDRLGAGFPGDVVVLCIFLREGRGIELNYDSRVPPFRFMDDLAVRPFGIAPHILGSLFYRSFLAHALGRWADRWIPRRWLVLLRALRPEESGNGPEVEPLDAFIERAVEEIRMRGAEPLVAFLPVPFEHSYEEEYAIVPPGVRWVDLHEELARAGVPMTTIARHYSADVTRAAGQILGREIDALLDEGSQPAR